MLEVFVSGIERQSGKTAVVAGLAATMQSLSYSTSVYKPIQTGAKMLNGFKVSQDVALIRRFDSNIVADATYVLENEATPFVSSYQDSVKISLNNICADFRNISKMTDCHIVEGVNSVSSPIAEHLTEIDIVKILNIPLLLVVNPKKTPIERVLASLSFVRDYRGSILGIIINQHDENSENLEEKYYPQILKEFVDVPILGVLPEYEDFDNIAPEILIADVLNKIDIEKVFGLKIAKLQQA